MSCQKAVLLFPMVLTIQLNVHVMYLQVTYTLLYGKEWKWWQHACVWNSLFLFFKPMQLTQVWHLWNTSSTSGAYCTHIWQTKFILCNVQCEGREIIIKTTQLSIGYKHNYKYNENYNAELSIRWFWIPTCFLVSRPC